MVDFPKLPLDIPPSKTLMSRDGRVAVALAEEDDNLCLTVTHEDEVLLMFVVVEGKQPLVCLSEGGRIAGSLSVIGGELLVVEHDEVGPLRSKFPFKVPRGFKREEKLR